MLGDVSSLGIQEDSSAIKKGLSITINETEKIEIALISDAQDFWPRQELMKILAKVKHTSNKNITIFQPRVRALDLKENSFVKIRSWAKEMLVFSLSAKWRLFGFSPSLGKCAINVNNYIEDIIKKGIVILPSSCKSAHIEESINTNSVLLEDVFVLEKIKDNKVSEFFSSICGLTKDLELIKKYLFKKMDFGKRSCIYKMIREMAGKSAFLLWVIGSIFALSGVFLGFLIFIVLLSLCLNYFVGFILYQRENDKYKLIDGEVGIPLSSIIGMGIIQTGVYVLIDLLDFLYQPIFLIMDILDLYQREDISKKLREIIGLSDKKTRTLMGIYKQYRIAVFFGIGIVFCYLFNIISGYSLVFLSPFLVSLLFGPAVVLFLSKN